MIGTTVLATLAMFTVWEASVFVAIPFLLIFGALLSLELRVLSITAAMQSIYSGG